MCSMIIEEDNQQKNNKKKKMAARNDFHWLRFFPISVDHIRVSFAFRRCLPSFTNSSQQKICDLSSSLWFSLSSPVLIVTCAVRSFRARIYEHIGSEGISLPCLAKNSFFSLSVFLIRSLFSWSSDSVHVCDVFPCENMCV